MTKFIAFIQKFWETFDQARRAAVLVRSGDYSGARQIMME